MMFVVRDAGQGAVPGIQQQQNLVIENNKTLLLKPQLPWFMMVKDLLDKEGSLTCKYMMVKSIL